MTKSQRPSAVNTAKKQKEPLVAPAPAAQPPAVKAPLAANVLEVVDDGSLPREEVLAASGLSTINLNAISSLNATRPTMGNGDGAFAGINAYAKVMKSKVKAVKDGDMSGPEATLVAQIVTLDCLFADLVRRAQTNFRDYLPAAETYMRLALRAQAQCRANVEALSEMKSPRPVYINPRQVNVANGPQQVNNGSSHAEPVACGKNVIQTNKLLGAG